MVDKHDDEDTQETVERIKDAAREALEGASSAIFDAKFAVQRLIDELVSDEAGAISDAVTELWSAINDLDRAEDALASAESTVQWIGNATNENEVEDEGGDENDEEGDSETP
jgi:hypothetical protein